MKVFEYSLCKNDEKKIKKTNITDITEKTSRDHFFWIQNVGSNTDKCNSTMLMFREIYMKKVKRVNMFDCIYRGVLLSD
jgi:hypothetical protein